MTPDPALAVLAKIVVALITVFGTVLSALVVQVLRVQNRHTVVLGALQAHFGLEVKETGKVLVLGTRDRVAASISEQPK